VPDFAVPWVLLPDSYVSGDQPDPHVRAVERDSVRLAQLAAVQSLPPRQLAMLLSRDVLAVGAAEVAEQLDASTAAVNRSAACASRAGGVNQGTHDLRPAMAVVAEIGRRFPACWPKSKIHRFGDPLPEIAVSSPREGAVRPAGTATPRHEVPFHRYSTDS
jgi:hypothetical protein